MVFVAQENGLLKLGLRHNALILPVGLIDFVGRHYIALMVLHDTISIILGMQQYNN